MNDIMSKFLDINIGLDLSDNDEELYKSLLNFYLTENAFDVKELHSNIMKSKLEGASYIHRIKGASRQIGATVASEKAQKIEDILREKDCGNLAFLINEFCAIYNSTLKEINEYLGLKEN